MLRKLMTRSKTAFLLLTLAFGAPLQLAAQLLTDESGNSLVTTDQSEYVSKGIASADIDGINSLSPVELEKLIGPIALYPDDILAIVLPASTYPLEIVLAKRFLDEYDIDSSIDPDEAWDESVIALLNYPEVLRMMDKEIDWTGRLGNAVISQQSDLIAAIESFRDRAYVAGNLETDEHQNVRNKDGVIEIKPVDKEVIYVPYYEPEKVIVHQTEPVYAYYPVPRPVYYYPYPAGYSFSNGRFWGVTTAFTIGWPNRYLNVHHRSYRGHPYYGRSYYGHYYRQPSISVYNTWYVHNSYHGSNHRDGDQWRSRNRHNRLRHDTSRVRNEYYPRGNRLNDRSENHSRGPSDARENRRGRTDGQNVARNSTNTNRAANNAANSLTRVNANNRRAATTDRLADRVPSGQRQNSRRDRGSDNSAIRFRNRAETDTATAGRGTDARREAQTNASRQRVGVTNSYGATSYQSVTTGQTKRNRTRRPAQPVTNQPSSRNRTTRQTGSQQTSSRTNLEPRTTMQRNPSRHAIQRQASNPPTTTRPSSQTENAISDNRSQQQRAPRQSTHNVSSGQLSGQNAQHSTGQRGNMLQRGQSSSRGNNKSARNHKRSRP